MRTKNIVCKVYLEGVNVSFNSIQIAEQVGAPPRAVVSFPADSAALTLLPKTVIHIYYEDDIGIDRLIFMGELAGSGISFTPDKRAINLTFTAFSQNWYTNVILPMDLKVRTMASNALYVQVNQAGDKAEASTLKFTDLKGLGFLDEILSKLENGGDTLPTIIQKLVNTFGEGFEGVYWQAVAKAFGFNSMVAIDGVGKPATWPIRKIQELLITVAVMQHIKGLAQGVSAGTDIHTLFSTILESCGFCYSEVAAPTDLGNTRAHILVKPKTHFFPPIRHNVVIDDEIVQLSFTRDFDREPTRLVGQTVPFFLPTNDINTTIVSVVVPNNVRLAQALEGDKPLNSTEVSNDQFKNLKMFGLSREEQCRGVVLSEHQDTSFIENSYLIALMKDAGENSDYDSLSDEKRKEVNGKFGDYVTGGGQMNESETYHMNIATTMYYDKRHQARTIQVNSPYSPYRMVDFPGVIISKYFPSNVPGIVGNLDSVSSVISADGEASQTLVYSHCRFVDANVSGTSDFYGFLDDDMGNPVPWYAEYVTQGNINSFYEQFTGQKNSAVIAQGGKAATAVYRAVQDIKAEVNKPENQRNRAEFIRRKTSRPLVTRPMIQKLFPNTSVRKLASEKNSPVTSITPAPYLEERRKRVYAVFKVKQG
jgi:hypothetical protein